jgi:hypothetical protein
MSIALMHSGRGVSRTVRARSDAFDGLVFEWCLCWLGIVALLVLAQTFVSPYWSLIAGALYVWVVLLEFRSFPVVTAVILPLIVSRFSILFALAFIEFGAPIPELGMVGDAGDYTARFVAYSTFYFLVIGLVATLMMRGLGKISPTPLDALLARYRNHISVGILLLVAFLVVALILNGLTRGFPLLQGIDRLEFRRYSTNAVTLYALNYKYPIMFLLGMVAFRLEVSRRMRGRAIIAAAVLFFIYFLFGDKFFIQLKGLCGFFVPYLVFNHQDLRKRLVPTVIVASVAMALVFGVTWNIYSRNGKLSVHETQTLLAGRIVGQGQLWFVQNKVGAPAFDWNSSLVSDNIASLTVKPDILQSWILTHSVGTAYFSNHYTPPKVRRALRNRDGSVGFNAAQDALGMAAFGWAGMLVYLAVGAVLTGGVVTYAVFAVRKRSAMSALFCAIIFLELDNALVQAAPWSIFNVYVFRWIVVMFAIEIFARIVVNLPARGGLRGRRAHARLRRGAADDGYRDDGDSSVSHA